MSDNHTEPASIDAIVHSPPESMPTTPAPEQQPEHYGADGGRDGPKVKGHKRLWRKVKRMTSSPSLARMGISTPDFRTGTKGSISCISLQSSPTPFGRDCHNNISPFAQCYPTAPTSAASTPGGNAHLFECTRPLTRPVGKDTPVSVGLPVELRPTPNADVVVEEVHDYFSRPVARAKEKKKNVKFWEDMPFEIRLQILDHLTPQELVRCSAVSKKWHAMCFDGQLWQTIDTSDYYRDIPSAVLKNIITGSGPFVKDLNLRGCVQLPQDWTSAGVVDACQNLESLALEDCHIERNSLHALLGQNNRLVQVNLCGLPIATNAAMKILGKHCPRLKSLNVSWCSGIDTRGLRWIVDGCPELEDLRAGESRGWDDLDFVFSLFERNTLERLVLAQCDSVTDETLMRLVWGPNPAYDYLAGRYVAPPRKLKHLDLSRCRNITDIGVKALAHNVPHLEGLQLSKCTDLTDISLKELLPTLTSITHLDLEELGHITSASLQALANSPARKHLKHLTISYCDSVGDVGVVPILQQCTQLASLEMDNTRISDLTLTEAATLLQARNRAAAASAIQSGLTSSTPLPTISLRLVVYDCQNVTWTGIREILSRNSEYCRMAGPVPGAPEIVVGPTHIIHVKCFYNWQPTVEAHTERVQKGDFKRAKRLERLWAEYMRMNEEATATGAGRRQRRRAREAQMAHADEAGGAGVGGSRRRRARSGPSQCAIM
ncbi:F-box/LRR repeat-containing protein 2 [Trichodelitschia bisporula]|uniref:F-box/LRR repeat-containing protein 2 n=1 Tax=Trichodelitschia bisporula TaxID=703511 RepID=A0A6G1I626_9PEZI|nr:F-box/LRR repeat-containing protein 2 [Trichodelitschia bisporula]